MPDKPKDALNRLIELFPPLFQVQKGMLLYDLLAAVAHELDQIDRELAYTFRSHMVDASDPDPDQIPADLFKIGMLFDILPEKDETAPAFRRRLKDTIKIYLSGLGTVDAVLKMAALTYGFSLSDGDIKRPDAGSPFVTTGGLDEKLFLRVVDTPPSRKRLSPTPLYPGLIFEVWNRGLFEAIPDIEIRTSDQMLRMPLITNLTTGQQLIFEKKSDGEKKDGIKENIIPPRTLFTAQPDIEQNGYIIRIGGTLRESGGVFKGHFFDTARFDQARFAEKGGLLRLPRGRSLIRFDLKPPVFNDAYFDISRFYSDPVGQWDLKYFDQSVFAPDSSLGTISFSWTERKPAAFRLDIPPSLFMEKEEATKKLLRVIGGIKPAGIEAIISTEKKVVTDSFSAVDRLVQISVTAPFSENAPMSGRFIRATDVYEESAKMNARLKTIETGRRSVREAQTMTETLRFEGAFDATRFESSVFT